MIDILNDIFNMAYSLGHTVNEIVLGYELYKMYELEVLERCRYEVENPKSAREIYFNNIKVTCDYNNPILIQVK